MNVEDEIKQEWDNLIEEFEAHWIAYGRPALDSPMYLALNRYFFYDRGFEKGVDFLAEAYKRSKKERNAFKPAI